MKNTINGIYEETLKNGGYTKKVNGRYIIGLENGYSRKIEATGYNQFYNTINKLEKENVSYGTWYNDGYIYIDENVQVNSLKKAVKIGKKQKQIAIFDITSNKEIKL